MALLDSLKERIMGQEEEEPRTYRYQCLNCHSELESTEPHADDVTCRECGSSNVQSLD